MTEYLLVASPYIPWALAVLLGVAWLWMWREARRAKRAVRELRDFQEQARRQAVTAKAEVAAIREVTSKHLHEVGVLQADLERREREIEDLRTRLNRGWLGDLTVTCSRVRAKGGEIRLWREMIPVETQMSAGKLTADHPSGDVVVFDYLLSLGITEPAGEKVKVTA